MVMQAQPIYDAWKSIVAQVGYEPRCVYLTPQGQVFAQGMAKEYAREEDLIFLCGHYEGVDERVLEEIVTDYVSIGDYVLTGGELPAMVMVDAISRMVPGVLTNEESGSTESLEGGLLEYPQYSRPASWNGKEVPQVLLSGDHKKIESWRHEHVCAADAAQSAGIAGGSRTLTGRCKADSKATEKIECVTSALLTFVYYPLNEYVKNTM